MNSEEIRKELGHTRDLKTILLVEIAAQLAELNERLGNWQGKLPIAIDAKISPGNTSGYFDIHSR